MWRGRDSKSLSPKEGFSQGVGSACRKIRELGIRIPSSARSGSENVRKESLKLKVPTLEGLEESKVGTSCEA